MKFNEKLMELRRKEGLSQEELGYKLNVTRQTVSKWELGQTTPEMDKLVEISKLFNMRVDDLINDSELENKTNPNPEPEPIIEDQPIKEKGNKNNKLYLILVGALILVIVLIIIKGVTGIFGKSKEKNSELNIFERFFGIFDRVISMQEDVLEKQEEMMGNTVEIIGSSDEFMNQAQNIIGNTGEIFENATSQMNTTRFNGTLELYKGSESGSSVKRLLDEIITSNKKEERKVTVKYEETETSDTEEIKTLKMNIKENNNFEVSFEYDDDGFITEAILERVYTEFEINRFNSSIEMSTGTKNGLIAQAVLDDVITSNKTEENKITVKYGNIETQDEAEVRKIKQGFDAFKNYEIYVEYDEVGFINRVIVEKL